MPGRGALRRGEGDAGLERRCREERRGAAEQAGGLPRVLRITDANAMLAGRTLSQLSRIKLIARVSNGGDALAQPGDVFGEALWAPGDGPVDIVMNQVVQP